MKRSAFITTIAIILLWGCSNKPKKQSPKYTKYNFGSYLFNIGKLDSAFLMFNSYVDSADDTLNKGAAYRYMGRMQWETGDFPGAEESLTGTIRTLDPLDTLHQPELGYAYNILGNICLDLKLYDSAISLYNIAIGFLKGSDSRFDAMNGKATALQKRGNYTEAIALYDSLLALKPADQQLLARIIDNGVRAKWLQDPSYPALPELRAALRIRADSQYNRGLNASYAHLSDYYAKLNPDSALWYAHKMREKAKEIQSPDDRLEATDKLIRLNSSSVAKEQWYDEFKALNDSVQLARDTTRNSFALIRYDVQKSKADNLVLQQHITTQQLLMYGLIALAAVIITGLSIWYAKRRKRLKQESENAIRDSKLKTSQKVHDVVANELYGIMNELEHGKEIDREPLLTRIEDLYEKSRDISYEDVVPTGNADYDKQIHNLLNDFISEQTDVFVVGNQQIFWDKVTSFQKNELLLILKEIMINMKKHSRATNVVIRFKQENQVGSIYYSDDGKGFPSDTEFGNGLKNTVNRIKSLNGAINFGKSDKAGASIAISFPLEPDKL